MKRSASIVLLLFCVPLGVLGQGRSEGNDLSAQQLEGMRHFNQSCRVCHTKPQMTSAQYAPVLSGVTLGGQEEALRVFIANGSAKMPGFKYHFKPAEIDAIVVYIKTLPQPSD